MTRFMFAARRSMFVTGTAARLGPAARLGMAAALAMAGPALAMAQPTPYLPSGGVSVGPVVTQPPIIEVPSPPPATWAYRPLVAVTAMPPAYEVGRGILGQPKLYVPRQPVRNFVRWLTP